MKKYFVVVTFLMSCMTVQAQSNEQTVLDLSKKKFEWMIRMKYDSLQSALDDRLVFIHSNGWVENKQELIQDIKSGKLRYTNITVLEATARVYPSTAIITGKGKFQVTLDGNNLELALSYTEVYVQKDGKWLLASRHANRMP
ncbi:MAG TPA: nuclear transport factor 2 family protein [Cyclobacteriaceae bacterium]|nr:nuclear transport factor 2 family protein [Cyclobacteriaceae bacterium]